MILFKEIKFWQINPAWIGLVFVLLVIGGVNRYASRSLPQDPGNRLANLLAANMLAEAEPVYRELLSSNPLSLDLNFEYIQNHFLVAANDQKAAQGLIAYFSELSNDAETRDLGTFSLGFIQAKQNDPEGALSYYRRVKDRNQKFLNYAIGNAYLDLGNDYRAEKYFQREIQVGGYLSGAVPNLVSLYMKHEQLDKLQGLIEDQRTRPFIALRDQRKLAFKTWELDKYLLLTFVQPLKGLSPGAIFVALLTGSVWLVYLSRIDIFSRSAARMVASLLILGAISSQASAIASDILNEILPLSFDGSWSQDLFFSIFYIGAVEEILKFLPVLLILFRKHRSSEPFDFIFYGSISALGFATLENAYYFNRNGIGIAASRFIFSTLMHLAMSAIAFYPLARAIYFKRKILPALLVGLTLASITHGLFDFFLLGSLTQLSVLSLFVLIGATLSYQKIIWKTLSSNSISHNWLFAPSRLNNSGLLFSAALLLFVLVFLRDHFTISTDIANRQLISQILPSLPVLLVGFGFLGNIRIR